MGRASQGDPLRRRRAMDPTDQPETQGLDDLVEEHAQVPTSILERVEDPESGRGVTGRERVEEAVDGLGIGEAEELTDAVGGDAIAARGQDLVQDRLRVPHPAGGQPGDQIDGLRIGLAAVGREDPAELAGDLGDGEAPDIEPLESREDGRGELLGVRAREHEGHEIGRLLERLEERVPGVLRDLMRLVEDVHLAPELRRGVRETLPQLADLVDPAVRGGIDLDHVERRAVADRDTRRAGVAGVTVRAQVGAVERLCNDARERRLARAARPREQDRVRDALGADGVAQGLDDGVLADDLSESLGPPASVEGLVGGGSGHDTPGPSNPKMKVAVHPPSIRTSPCPSSKRGSDQAVPRHPTIIAECCFLPDLTRFASRRCAGPGRQRHTSRRPSRTPTSGGDSALLERIAGTGHR